MADSIVSKTKNGMIWNSLEKGGLQVISFVFNIILARLLTPSDYGTVGLLTIFLTFSNVFIDSGFPRALIQKQDRSEKDFSTTFIFNIFVSAIIYTLLFFASPAIARFYNKPELVSLQRVLFLVIILQSLTMVQNTKLQIDIDFKKICIITLLSVIISGSLGVFFAYKGFGVWALVIQNVSRNLVNLIMYWTLCHWIPKTGFSWESFKSLFSFGSKLLLSSFIVTTVNNIKNLVIGKAYSPEELGFYTRGQQFPDLVSGTLSSVLNTATFPLLSSLQKEKENLVSVFRRLICFSSLLAFPCMAGMALLSKNIVLVLLGEKWLPCAFFLTCISLEYLFRPLNILNMNILNAIGRSDLFLKVDLIKIPLDIILMAATLPFGVRVFALVGAIYAFIPFCINAFLIGKLYGFGPLRQLICAWKGILSTMIMSVILIFLNAALHFNESLKLLFLIFTGVVVYYLSLKILKESELISIEKKLFQKFRKQPDENS